MRKIRKIRSPKRRLFDRVWKKCSDRKKHVYIDENYKNCLICRRLRDVKIKKWTDFARSRLCSECLKNDYIQVVRRNWKYDNYPCDSELKEIFWLQRTGKLF